MTKKLPEPELDHAELSRRALADMEEALVEFQLGMDDVIGGLNTAKDAFQMEADGKVARPFGEDTPLRLSDAVYLPILGGEVRRNGERLPSPTFTKRSLEGAIKAGHLDGRLLRGKWTVTILALKAWLDGGAQTEAKPAAVKPARSVAAVSNRERERRAASNAIAREMLASIGNTRKR
ncbi:hypothetical protein ASD54_08875 [Rhizobium sp. Root149]|uniref:hypothetical protein n=1 Tax=Rhizobium sp. Root149 TaxID=1736473 RepID=UPI0007143C13|nr:hypothetical protein [Rhizobium sp. Root149]KQZ50357.1 hypothetical protein ASD54_08875 [Rhizobium sp. Root149]